MNLQVFNSQRCEHASLNCFFKGKIELNPAGNQSCAIRVSDGILGVSEIAACPRLLLLMTLQLYHLPPLFPSPSGTLLDCSLDASLCMPAIVLYYCTVLL